MISYGCPVPSMVAAMWRTTCPTESASFMAGLTTLKPGPSGCPSAAEGASSAETTLLGLRKETTVVSGASNRATGGASAGPRLATSTLLGPYRAVPRTVQRLRDRAGAAGHGPAARAPAHAADRSS